MISSLICSDWQYRTASLNDHLKNLLVNLMNNPTYSVNPRGINRNEKVACVLYIRCRGKTGMMDMRNDGDSELREAFDDFC